MRDMAFHTALMADPVVASDGITYERRYIEQWMQEHDVSPLTNEPFEHKMLIPNVNMRKLIAAWCEENGVPKPKPPAAAVKAAAAGGGVAQVPLLHKPQVTCSKHAKEQLRAFCMGCEHGVCFLCAVDTKGCKTHATEAFDTLLEELQTEEEGWARAQEECRRGGEQLCASIQADTDAKLQAITAEGLALQQQVRAAAEGRVAAIGAIVQKRRERRELVTGAAACAEVAVKGSAAAAVVAAAIARAKAPIPPASAAEFRAAAAPAAAVGHVVVADAVVDPEDEAARAAAAAAAAEAAAVAAMGALSSSALLQRVADRNKVQQFAALMRGRLAGRGYRLLYTWSRDGRSNASFHQRCDNQVRAVARGVALQSGCV